MFKFPRVSPGSRSVELRASELAMILDGIDVTKLKRVPRYERSVRTISHNKEAAAVSEGAKEDRASRTNVEANLRRVKCEYGVAPLADTSGYGVAPRHLLEISAFSLSAIMNQAVCRAYGAMPCGWNVR
jgi:hypothetical protein